jgi:RimJ/RimL family protein N-acetyltransferase
LSQRLEHALFLRAATIEDWALLLEWRNDPQTRSASRNQEPIEKESHLKWLTDNLKNSDSKLLIAELDCKPVGAVRIDFGPQSEISWTVAPFERGRGIGTQMIALAVRTIDMPLIAVARTSNIASIRIAEASGFRLVKSDGEWVTLRRAPNDQSQQDE